MAVWCGTSDGLDAHAVRGERPCGRCILAEQARQLTAERFAPIPGPADSSRLAADAAVLELQAANELAAANRRRLRLLPSWEAS